MAVLVKGWHGSSGTRFPKCCQVEKDNKSENGREDVPFFLSHLQKNEMALLF